MTSNSKKVFSNFAIAHIKGGITAVATTIYLYPGEGTVFLPGWESGSEFYCTIVDAARNIEVVKVTDLSEDTLTVERNADGGGYSSFPAGSPIMQRVESTQLDDLLQKAVSRTISYNPNGILTADYPGEKIYQTGSLDCQIRWWKNTSGNLWRLIASGALCDFDYEYNGYIYSYVLDLIIFGGTGGGLGSLSQDTDAYNTSGQTWASLADMPDPARFKHGGAKIGDYAYSFAGENGTGTSYQDNDEYGFDAWAAKTDLPTPARSEAPGCGYQVNENPFDPEYAGFVVGGNEGGTGAVLQDTDKYSQDGDSWSGEADFPAPARSGIGLAGDLRTGHAIFGGSAGVSFYQDTDYFQEDSWSSLSDMPTPARRDVAAGSYADIAYIFGGRSSADSYLADTDSFNMDTDTWTSETDLPSPDRRSSGAGTFEDYIYIMSGENATYDNDKYDITGDSFTAETDVPSPDRRYSAVVGFA